jgi:uncharacterized membrane protein YbaN (DUF454 family)
MQNESKALVVFSSSILTALGVGLVTSTGIGGVIFFLILTSPFVILEILLYIKLRKK